MRKTLVSGMLVIGGLHMDDFEWASTEYEDAGYVLICFELDADGYHWRAIYAKANLIEKTTMKGVLLGRLSLSLHTPI